jgi:nucleoside-diphosphate-sugar epimerase
MNRLGVCIREFRLGQGFLRMLADFLIVHACMILALALTVIYHVNIRHGAQADEMIRRFSRYYLGYFLLLSLIFPLVSFVLGVYSQTRNYPHRAKVLLVGQGVGIGVLLYLAANFLIFRQELVSRSTALLFAMLAPAGAMLARVARDVAVRYSADLQKSPGPRTPAEDVILVVGGAGYIGSMLCRKILAAGHKVRVLDCLLYGDGSLQELVADPRFELMAGDCRNIQNVVCAFKGVKSVVHLAAIVGDPACEQDRQTAMEVNYAATRMLIEVAKGHGVERFLFASSCSVYGASDLLMDENSVAAPLSLYGQTKVDSEKALLEARTKDFHPTVLRLATVFGHGYRPRFDLVVNLLTAKAYQDEVITILNGHQWRPFIHVRDVADAIVYVLDAPVALVSGETLNVGENRLNYSLDQVAEKLQQAFPKAQIRFAENSDRRNYRVSFQRIARLGFHCHLTLDDGIEELKRAFEEGTIRDYTDSRYHNQRFLKDLGRPVSVSEIDTRVMAAFS